MQIDHNNPIVKKVRHSILRINGMNIHTPRNQLNNHIYKFMNDGSRPSMPNDQSGISVSKLNNQSAQYRSVSINPNQEHQDNQYLKSYLQEIISQNTILMKKIQQKDLEIHNLQKSNTILQEKYNKLVKSIYGRKQSQSNLNISEISEPIKYSRLSSKSIENKKKLNKLQENLKKIDFKNILERSRKKSISKF